MSDVHHQMTWRERNLIILIRAGEMAPHIEKGEEEWVSYFCFCWFLFCHPAAISAPIMDKSASASQPEDKLSIKTCLHAEQGDSFVLSWPVWVLVIVCSLWIWPNYTSLSTTRTEVESHLRQLLHQNSKESKVHLQLLFFMSNYCWGSKLMWIHTCNQTSSWEGVYVYTDIFRRVQASHFTSLPAEAQTCRGRYANTDTHKPSLPSTRDRTSST